MEFHMNIPLSKWMLIRFSQKESNRQIIQVSKKGKIEVFKLHFLKRKIVN